MRVIYTSKGAMKMLGCALFIEKYGNYIFWTASNVIQLKEQYKGRIRHFILT
jgi:hypothetical protein